MARMPGHYGGGECGCSDCSPPRGRHSARLSSRWRKRIEQRELEREFAELADWYGTGEAAPWVTPLPEDGE